MTGGKINDQGINSQEINNPASNDPAMNNRVELTLDDYFTGVISGDRSILARALTLVESNAERHQQMAGVLLEKFLAHIQEKSIAPSIRVGLTGVPGAGKSTFIEALGCYLVKDDNKVAVLAIDPSSTIHKGSILGDKTRMEKLARDKRSFIRPSPSSGALGGVARKTRESIIVCEAAGYNVILVETVGVGQSEASVRSMVDFFLLLSITGAGDELQSIKKGVIELADAILINKADGDNAIRAKRAAVEFSSILRFLEPATPGWQPVALPCSSLTGEGVAEIWKLINEFFLASSADGRLSSRRQTQELDWFHDLLFEGIKEEIFSDPRLSNSILSAKKRISSRQQTVTQAVRELVSGVRTTLGEIQC